MPDSPLQSFLAQAEEHPQAEAIRGAQSWTYGRLAKLSAAIARYLLDSGLETGDRVAMLLPNCGEYVAIYFGTLLAGGVIVPLNTLDKPRTVFRQAEHCAAKFVFVGGARTDLHVAEEAWESPRYICVTADRAGDEGEPWRRLLRDQAGAWKELASRVRAEDLAAILYTSGTTGRPKGVMLSHGNLLANMESILGFLPIKFGDRCLVVLPFYYSFGNSLLTTNLSAGATLVLQNNIAFPKQVLDRIEIDHISSLYGVPLTFSLLFGKGVPEGVDLSPLRFMAQAGGAMPRAQADHVRRVVPGADLYVMYGQTEATARLTYVPPEKLQAKSGSAGKAIPGVEIEIRGDDGVPLPPGRIGEIWVRGENVMMGYWEDPAESSQVLRDGWLWTRDRGYLDDDGYLFIQGRSSDMIKTGANRVSPAEIEEVIGQLDGVSEVGVTAVHDDVLGQAVLAAIVPEDGKHLTPRAVKAFCRDHLAAYKVPKRVEIVPELPRTSTGKIQRNVLAQRFPGEDNG